MLDYKQVIAHLYQARALIYNHCATFHDSQLWWAKHLLTIDRSIQSIEKQTKKILFSPDGPSSKQ